MPPPFRLKLRAAALPVCLSLVLALQACGGGGDGGGATDTTENNTNGTPTTPAAPTAVYFDAPFVPSYKLANQCTDLRQKQFIRSYLDEVHLWPDKIQRINAAAFSDVQQYFGALLPILSGDHFSYSQTTADANAQEEGRAFDVGILWRNAGTSTAPIWRVAKVDPGSPADLNGIRRGDTLVSEPSTGPDNATYELTYERNGVRTTVSMTPTTVMEEMVDDHRLVPAVGRRVGYLNFESHLSTAQDELIEQIQQLHQAQVDELVLDLRYNGGGYLYIAASLASMLAPSQTVREQPVFARQLPNAKRQAEFVNAVDYFSPTVMYSPWRARYPAQTTLPSLNLKRVYVLATGATCSASEALVNGLRGVGVTVHLIGSTTCGKPYGMYRRDNCGVAFHPIEFGLVNAQGRGDYTDGFKPTCEVHDDFDHERGSPDEAMLNAALVHMQTGKCPNNPGASSPRVSLAQASSRPMGSVITPAQRFRPALSLPTPR